MKPQYWNKGKSFLSNKDRVLKSIIENFPNENLEINSNHYHSLLNSIIGQQISQLILHIMLSNIQKGTKFLLLVFVQVFN